MKGNTSDQIHTYDPGYGGGRKSELQNSAQKDPAVFSAISFQNAWLSLSEMAWIKKDSYISYFKGILFHLISYNFYDSKSPFFSFSIRDADAGGFRPVTFGVLLEDLGNSLMESDQRPS